MRGSTGPGEKGSRAGPVPGIQPGGARQTAQMFTFSGSPLCSTPVAGSRQSRPGRQWSRKPGCFGPSRRGLRGLLSRARGPQPARRRGGPLLRSPPQMNHPDVRHRLREPPFPFPAEGRIGGLKMFVPGPFGEAERGPNGLRASRMLAGRRTSPARTTRTGLAFLCRRFFFFAPGLPGGGSVGRAR